MFRRPGQMDWGEADAIRKHINANCPGWRASVFEFGHPIYSRGEEYRFYAEYPATRFSCWIEDYTRIEEVWGVLEKARTNGDAALQET